jgi:hypothetical protein
MSAHERSPNDIALDRVRDALAGLRYGEVTLIVHDGTVVQVERTEKLRLQRAVSPQEK